MSLRATTFVSSIVLAAVSLTLISPASAQVVRRSTGDGADVMARPYGTTPGEENAPITGSTRDANNNRVIVDGQYVGDSYSRASEDLLTYGVGRGGTGAGGTTATAVGNLLNVTVLGNNNTVIVNSDQQNSGDQSVVLNGGVNLD